MKRKYYLGIIVFIMTFFIMTLYEQKAYAYEVNSLHLETLKTFYNEQLKSTYPYCLITYCANSDQYALFYGLYEFGYYESESNKSLYCLNYPTIGMRNKIWMYGEVLTRDNPETLYNGLVYTSFGPTITPLKVYCNFDLKSITYNTGTSSFDVGSIIYPSDEIQVPDNWSYEYDNTIPNVQGLTIQTHAWYRTSWGLVVGESKDKYEIKWTVPQGAGLILEIQVASKFNNVERRKFKQRYDYPWAEGYTVMPETGEMNMSLMQVGTWCLHNVWNDVDTGSWFNIPPTKLYFRYAVMDGNTKKVKYGNWTRMQFSGGSNGIIETRKDTITTSEQFDQTTGETIYTDTPIEGNETEYINRDGEIVDESQSFNAVVDTVGNAIESSTSALNNIGSWLGQVPELVGNLFTFLPPEIIAFIGLGIALVVILRIAGR